MGADQVSVLACSTSLASSLAAGLDVSPGGPVQVPDWPIVRLDNVGSNSVDTCYPKLRADRIPFALVSDSVGCVGRRS